MRSVVLSSLAALAGEPLVSARAPGSGDGQVTALAAVVGSVSRPVGGLVADRVGGVRVLAVTLAGVALVYALAARLPDWRGMVALVVVGMGCLGIGNGAVFQLVPQRFRREIGVMTGLVGMAGGVGGFYLASSLGYAKQATGSYQPGFLIFAALALAALVGLSSVKTRWRTTWGAAHLTSAKI